MKTCGGETETKTIIPKHCSVVDLYGNTVSTPGNHLHRLHCGFITSSIKMPRIPDRWEDYHSVGKPIAGTRFITFKVPLKQHLCASVPDEQQFTPGQLLTLLKEDDLKLGIIIDLTNTARYYDPNVFKDAGLEYQKIFTEGKVVPSDDVKMRFLSIIDDYLERNPENDTLIGVHCTHGVNRTGHLVCRYMIDRLKFEPDDAIKGYDEARGHNIERENYLQDLRTCKTDMEKYQVYKSKNKVTEWTPQSLQNGNNHQRYNPRNQDTDPNFKGRYNDSSQSNWRENGEGYQRGYRQGNDRYNRDGNWRDYADYNQRETIAGNWRDNRHSDWRGSQYNYNSRDQQHESNDYNTGSAGASGWNLQGSSNEERTFGRNDYWESHRSQDTRHSCYNETRSEEGWGGYNSRDNRQPQSGRDRNQYYNQSGEGKMQSGYNRYSPRELGGRPYHRNSDRYQPSGGHTQHQDRQCNSDKSVSGSPNGATGGLLHNTEDQS